LLIRGVQISQTPSCTDSYFQSSVPRQRFCVIISYFGKKKKKRGKLKQNPWQTYLNCCLKFILQNRWVSKLPFGMNSYTRRNSTSSQQ